MTSSNNKELFTQFRTKFKDTYLFELEDHLLWPLLLACKGDQDKGKAMCFRLVEATYNLTNSRRISYQNYIPLEEVVCNLIHKILGNDEQGRPVIWIVAGDWNPRELIEKGLKKELFMFIFKMVEKYCLEFYNQSKQSGGQPTTGVFIVDLKNITLKKFFHFKTIRYLLRYAKDIQPFTTLVHKVYIINCSWPFYYFLNVVKPFITKKALNKIVVLDLDENKWKESLRKNLSEDLLPNEYGGTAGKVFA